MKLPRVALPPEPQGSRAEARDIVALSSRNVWIAGNIHADFDPDDSPAPLVLHWDGRRWRRAERGLPREATLTRLAGGGSGGTWVTTGSGTARYSGGQWIKVPISRDPRGWEAGISGLARIPGTASFWGVGRASLQPDPEVPPTWEAAVLRSAP